MIVNVRPSYVSLYSAFGPTNPYNTERVRLPSGYYGFDSVRIRDFVDNAITLSPSFDAQSISAGKVPYHKYDGFKSVTLKGYKTRQLSLSPSTSSQSYTSTADNIINSVSLSGAKLQRGYTMSPSQSSQSATLDSDCYAFETITVKGAKLEERPVAAITSSDQEIKPSAGYYGLKLVTVPAQFSMKTIKTSTYNPLYIPNTAGITNISVIAIYHQNGTSPYNDNIAAIFGSALYGNYLLLVDGDSVPFEYDFSTKVSINNNAITIDVTQDYDDVYEVFVAGT